MSNNIKDMKIDRVRFVNKEGFKERALFRENKFELNRYGELEYHV